MGAGVGAPGSEDDVDTGSVVDTADLNPSVRRTLRSCRTEAIDATLVNEADDPLGDLAVDEVGRARGLELELDPGGILTLHLAADLAPRRTADQDLTHTTPPSDAGHGVWQ